MTTNTDNNVPLIGREEPSELMRYTNASGLKGIVESQTLWATNALFLSELGINAEIVVSDIPYIGS